MNGRPDENPRDENPHDENLGGDPVCWAHLLCPECGAVPDPGEENLEHCPRCGAERPPSEGPPSEGAPADS